MPLVWSFCGIGREQAGSTRPFDREMAARRRSLLYLEKVRGGRDHMNLDFMNSIPAQPDATPTRIAIWLAIRAAWPGGAAFCI
jgi:hypothetical protein